MPACYVKSRFEIANSFQIWLFVVRLTPETVDMKGCRESDADVNDVDECVLSHEPEQQKGKRKDQQGIGRHGDEGVPEAAAVINYSLFLSSPEIMDLVEHQQSGNHMRKFMSKGLQHLFVEVYAWNVVENNIAGYANQQPGVYLEMGDEYFAC